MFALITRCLFILRRMLCLATCSEILIGDGLIRELFHKDTSLMYFQFSNATMTEPSTGWTESGLSSLFTSANSSNPGKANTLSKGDIAGIVLGAIASISISSICIIFFYLRYRRSRSSRDLAKPQLLERSALAEMTSTPHGNEVAQSAYSGGRAVSNRFQLFNPSPLSELSPQGPGTRPVELE